MKKTKKEKSTNIKKILANLDEIEKRDQNLKYKAMILVQFLQKEFDNPDFEDFFNYHDLGLPLAISVESNLCSLNDEGIEVLNETYISLCNELEVEPTKFYESYA